MGLFDKLRGEALKVLPPHWGVSLRRGQCPSPDIFLLFGSFWMVFFVICAR